MSNRNYDIHPSMIRLAFVGSVAGAAGLVVLLLILATARPQGDFKPALETQYNATVEEAALALSGVTSVTDGVSIPITDAMKILASQGLAETEAMMQSEAALAAKAAAAQAAETTDSSETTGTDASAETTVEDTSIMNEELLASAQAGETVYASCMACHQATGQGIPAAFPALVTHGPKLYAADRDYPIDIVLYGLQGEIEVEGQTYNNIMTPWAQLSDDDIANVLNYVMTSWGNDALLPENFEAYQAADVEAKRGKGWTGADVYDSRPDLSGASSEAEASEEADAEGEESATTEEVEASGISNEDIMAALPDGEQSYAACSACHQSTGEGIPGAFPPLKGHITDVYQAEGGREYLILQVLYGLQGEINVQGTTYNGVMPAQGYLSDDQLAAALNHELMSWGNAELLGDEFVAFSVEDIAAERETALTAAEVYERRQGLGLE